MAAVTKEARNVGDQKRTLCLAGVHPRSFIVSGKGGNFALKSFWKDPEFIGVPCVYTHTHTHAHALIFTHIQPKTVAHM